MGRHNPAYHKSLHQQAYAKLNSMQAFGESKRDAIANGAAKDKIFSYSTYTAYWKHIKYFIHWLAQEYPECTTLKSARRHVGEWLQSRTDQGLSAWTVHVEAKALGKLFGIQPDDLDYFKPPERRREDITRSRTETESAKKFSTAGNAELISFCKGVGGRRNVIEKLKGRDLWTRDRMVAEVRLLENKAALSDKEQRHLNTLQEALRTFPDQTHFIHHRKDKNGRYRFAPIMAPALERNQIIERFLSTPADSKVWDHVPKNAPIHSYRSDYCRRVYNFYARNIEDIPRDAINKGTGRRYQSEVYVCRGNDDIAQKKYDRVALSQCSAAMGHSRTSVVIFYLRDE